MVWVRTILACLLVSKVSAFINLVTSNPSRIKRIKGGSNNISLHRSGISIEPITRNLNVFGNTFTSKRHWLHLLSSKEGDDIEGINNGNLDKFRSLMGSLYGVAGLAHAGDCYFGESKLLVAAGSPAYPDLPLEGKALVAIWCAAGPLAFVTSRTKNSSIADWGLLFYGVVEVLGAAIIKTTSSTITDIDALTNSIFVQAVVLASWFYSRKKDA